MKKLTMYIEELYMNMKAFNERHKSYKFT